MHALHIVSYVFGGAMLMNTVPHLVSGAMGRKFPSPFAQPPGKGLSSALTNVLRSFGNLAIAYLLVCQVGRFGLQNTAQTAALALGALTMGAFHARCFGDLNGGAGPHVA
jgi:hypothetical protein